jgi:glycosyltransferase involved in cell wall biosynthesis
MTMITAEDLKRKLWGGFSQYALPEIDSLKRNVSAPVLERKIAAWQLMRWFYFNKDYALAYENVSFIRTLEPTPSKKTLVAELQCLIKLRRFSEAEDTADHAMRSFGEKPDFLLLKSTIARNVEAERTGDWVRSDELQLKFFNLVLERANLSPILKRDKSRPLAFSNITAQAKPRTGAQDLKVSIILPAFNAEKTIHIAIQSLLNQTWRNLEVIVVDDCSSDSTCETVDRLSELDDRIKLVRKPVNEGAYPARNTGLKHAAGDLIMAHDCDDWSHPQKIEIQIQHMKKAKTCIAVMSHWVRVGDNLEVIGSWAPKGHLPEMNFSSLMFKRQVLDTFGGWDHVRINGDAEFRYRMLKYYGEDCIVQLPRKLLLSLALTRENSLTLTKATHERTSLYGLRRQYKDAFNYWHSSSAFQKSPKLDGTDGKIPVPIGMRSKQTESYVYDIVFIADYSRNDKTFEAVLDHIVFACRAKKRVAIFHWPGFEENPYADLNYRLYESILKYNVDILTPGDKVESDMAVIRDPGILQHCIDTWPEISTKRLYVIINKLSATPSEGGNRKYDPLVARAHLKRIFGQEGEWVPASSCVGQTT